jgi:hypothetical protein
MEIKDTGAGAKSLNVPVPVQEAWIQAGGGYCIMDPDLDCRYPCAKGLPDLDIFFSTAIGGSKSITLSAASIFQAAGKPYVINGTGSTSRCLNSNVRCSW